MEELGMVPASTERIQTIELRATAENPDSEHESVLAGSGRGASKPGKNSKRGSAGQ